MATGLSNGSGLAATASSLILGGRGLVDGAGLAPGGGLGGSGWTPTSLGASLLAWWDAERSDLITQAAGAVSSWRDVVGGYNCVQATGTAQPIYSATSFGGRPGVTGDGVDDYLRLATVPAGIPTGAAPCEIWLLADQAALPADATNRCAFGWGNASTNNRYVMRGVVSTVNRARAGVGDGATGVNVTNATGDFSGRHVVRVIISATATQVDMDGVTGTPAAVVPATTSGFVSLFALPAASTFWQGTISAALVTAPLNATQASQMYAYLNGRVAAFDADVVTWAAAVNANGGTVSSGRAALVSTMVAAWKAAGTWAVIDDAWLLVAENSQQALTSLKQRRLATAVAAPTFTVDRGYAFNGTTQYIDTLFVPSTHKVAMTGTSLHLAVYERTNVGANTVAAGCLTFSTSNMIMFPRSAANVGSVQMNSSPGAAGGETAITDSRGLTVGTRNGTLGSDVTAYKNGVAIVPNPQSAVSSSAPTTKVYIGCRGDGSNVAVGFRAATEGFVSVGADIPASLQPAFYNALQSYMTAVGANV